MVIDKHNMATASASGSDKTRMHSPSYDKKRMHSPSYGSELVQSLNQLKANDELCDFTVSAEGKSIQVHKILLAATSDYFRAMLQGPMRESKEAKVDLKGLSSQGLDHIIDFIYTGEMWLHFENLIEILNAGSHLQVAAALDLCSEYIISLLTFSNADEFLSIADTYSLTRVTDFYKRKVLHSFDEFSVTEQFLALTADKLARYLADDDLRVRSESVVYEAVARWYAHEHSRRDDVIDSLMQHVRFCLLSENQLVQLSQHWLTRQLQANMRFISAGLEYHHKAAVGFPFLLTAASTSAAAASSTSTVNSGRTTPVSNIQGSQAKVRAAQKSLVLVHQGSSYRPFEVSGYNEEEKKFYQLVADISGSRDCRVAELDNFLYVCRVVDCGGGTLMNSLLRFDPRHLSLAELTPCRTLRIDAALVSYSGRFLYVFGGTSENFAALDSVECYDSHANTWRIESTPLPSPAHSQTGVECGGLIYLSGGVSSQERQPTSSLFVYDPKTHTYTSKQPMHCARRLHEMAAITKKVNNSATNSTNTSSVSYKKQLYVLGGIGGHNVHQQTQIPIEMYDIATDQWTILTSTLAGRSVGHFLPYADGILSIGREHHDATEDEIWRYDMNADSWSSYTRMPRRNGLSAAAAAMLAINFHDEKVYRRAISDKR